MASDNSSDYDFELEESDTDEDTAGSSRRRIRKSSDNGHLTSDNWTLTEKRQLFNAIADYGSSNLKLLSRHIPTKSKENIKQFLSTYKRIARKCIKSRADACTKLLKEPRRAPIDEWISYINNSMRDNSHKSMLFARAFKYIALFEPRIGLTNVRLRHCYEVLSACLEGEAPRYLNRESSAFLVDNLQKLAKDIRFMRNPDEEAFLKGPKRRPGIRCYGGKKQVTNEDTDNLLLNDACLNPLHVPEKLLYM